MYTTLNTLQHCINAISPYHMFLQFTTNSLEVKTIQDICFSDLQYREGLQRVCEENTQNENDLSKVCREKFNCTLKMVVMFTMLHTVQHLTNSIPPYQLGKKFTVNSLEVKTYASAISSTGKVCRGYVKNTLRMRMIYAHYLQHHSLSKFTTNLLEVKT